MRVANCKQMKAIDEIAINEFGIPGIVLMENAAIAVVKEIERTLGEIRNKSVTVFCGKGNNGGDGFAVARHLFNLGAHVLVVIVGKKEEIQGDALINLNIIENMNLPIIQVSGETYSEETMRSLFSCDLIVDALLGTGIRGKVNGVMAEVIHQINLSGNKVVSIDVPSGINGNTGEVCGVCIHAEKTVTFALPKQGLLMYPGAAYVGELVVADISIPGCIIEEQKINVHTIEKEYVQSLFPNRNRDSHKGDFGRIFIIAGSKGMTGAAVMAASAAMKSGAGLVTVGCPASLNDILEVKLTEEMTLPLEDGMRGVLSPECIKKILSKLSKSDVILFGPGLSEHPDIYRILESVLSWSGKPVIIDADGINALSSNINILRRCKVPIVLTPHPGEMSRLIGIGIKDIQADRINIARTFAMEWNVILVLKGARTIVAQPDGQIYINLTGNPGMATAGSGDVLAGMIASFIGQGLSADDAAIAAVYMHGYAGDIAAQKYGEHPLVATDIIKALPEAFKAIVGNVYMTKLTNI